MTYDFVFGVILIGHLIGDFYLQTNAIAKNKDDSLTYFSLHVIQYTMSMGLILLIGIPYSANLLFIWLSSSILHVLVDIFKRWIRKSKGNNPTLLSLKNHSFITDQLLHIASIIAVWYIWGRDLSVRPFVELNVPDFPEQPILILLCLLIILRPVGILIGSGELWDFKKHNIEPAASVRNAGRMIGYLERTIILFFLIHRQFGAIAFVLTAKSVARFKEIENNKNMAEYYLIGTLLSVVMVLVSAFILGLCGGS